MRLLQFLNGFIDLFRSRYVRYLEDEVVRLRQEVAGLNHTLLSTKGIHQVTSPDMQDLTARGRELRHGPKRREPGQMRPVVGRTTHAKLRRQLELASAKEAAEEEQIIRQRREERAKQKEAANAAQ